MQDSAEGKCDDKVHRMMGRDWRPVSRITDRFRPKPRRMTAYWRTFLEQ